MNRKSFKIIFIISLCVISFNIIKADILVTYTDATNEANNYISSFHNYNNFITFAGKKYSFTSGISSTNSAFNKGGLLNEDEYSFSLYKGSTYLLTGTKYYTMTNGGKYVITDMGKKTYLSTEKYGVRVTEFVKESIKVSGNGSISDPWTFIN